MNKPPSWSSREKSLLLLNAYLDNELDAASVLNVEQRIASNATLKAEYDQLVQLRAVLASKLPRDRASAALRDRVAAIGASAPTPASTSPSIKPRRLLPQSYAWQQMAAAAVIAACLASGATFLGMRQGTTGSEIAGIVAGHQRALLAPAPFDIASSDRHTVKPWFDTKLALSPQVVDLSDAGFPLAGGRVDIVDGKPVPVMVYRRRAHVISVLAFPRIGNRDDGRAPTRSTEDGYSVLRWEGNDFSYAAVSDLAEDELEEFVSQWRMSTRPK